MQIFRFLINNDRQELGGRMPNTVVGKRHLFGARRTRHPKKAISDE